MANEIGFGQELTATQLDAQRARNLLDRALGLSERNDIAGAIVTCRQSLALAPNSPQGWSMLGLLSERDGDIHGAIEAYEKTLQLSPGSIYERESLQRLRQKRGAAPRPAPKFNFDAISTELPKAPGASITPAAIPLIPLSSTTQIRTESFVVEKSKTFWDTFYFRSLPVLIAAVVCLSVILIAQRVAANRQTNLVQSIPSAPAPTDVSTQSTASPVTPNTLAPLGSTQPKLAPATPSENVSPALDQKTSPPVATPTSTPQVEARPKVTPKAAVPSEMPVLPRPRLTVPQKTAPTSAFPKNSSSENSSNNAPIIGGGPVDVGNSSDSKYIPINPPHFPNASRD